MFFFENFVRNQIEKWKNWASIGETVNTHTMAIDTQDMLIEQFLRVWLAQWRKGKVFCNVLESDAVRGEQ